MITKDSCYKLADFGVAKKFTLEYYRSCAITMTGYLAF